MAAALANAAAAHAAPEPPPGGAFTTAILISSRMKNPPLLIDAVKDGTVCVLYYNFYTSTPEGLLQRLREALRGARMRSLALMTHGKPGAIGLTQGTRTHLQSLKERPELRAFWCALASEFVQPEGRIDLLSCSVAGSKEGVRLVDRLEGMTNLNFAASDDVTRAGNFVLETDGVNAGEVYFDVPKLNKWTGTAFLGAHGAAAAADGAPAGAAAARGADGGGSPPPKAAAPARSCRDVLFALLFLAYWVGMVAVAGLGWARGDPNRLLHGVDSAGYTCGTDHATTHDYTFRDGDGAPIGVYVDPLGRAAGPDFSARDKLLWLDPVGYAQTAADVSAGLASHADLLASPAVCVDACPGVADACDLLGEAGGERGCASLVAGGVAAAALGRRSLAEEADADADAAAPAAPTAPTAERAFACRYNATWGVRYFDALGADDQLASLAFLEEEPASGPQCYPVFMPTAERLGRCVPYPTERTRAAIEEQGLAALDAAVGQLGAGGGGASGAAARLRREASALWRAREVLLVAGVVGPFLMCVAFMLALRLFAGVLVWTLVAALHLGLGLAALGCAAKAGLLGAAGGEVGGRLEGIVAANAPDVRAERQTFEGAAYAFAALFAVVALITVALRKRVALAIALSKAAAVCVASSPAMALFPVIPLAFNVALLVYWAAVAALLYTAGTIVPDAEECVDGACVGTLEGYHLEWDAELQGAMGFHFFGLLWTLEFGAAVTRLALAAATAGWYFGSGEGMAAGAWVAARYHLGTAALGGFLSAALKAVILVVEAVSARTKGLLGSRGSGEGGGNQGARYVAMCVGCCLRCVKGLAEYASKNAYVVAVVENRGFCEGVGRGGALILGNALRAAAVGVVSKGVVLVGRLAACVFAAALGAFVSGAKRYSGPAGPNAQLYVESGGALVVALCALSGLFVGTLFMAVFEMVCDGMLVCVCLDEEGGGGGKGGGLSERAPAVLRDVLGGKGGGGSGAGRDGGGGRKR
eukprot:PRCOL_00001912-RA